MDIAYRCDRINGITYVVWDGRTSLDEWTQAAQSQLKDPEWPAGPLYISDLRHAILNTDEFKPAVQPMAVRFRTSGRIDMLRKHAIVAGLNFSLANLFQATLTGGLTECIAFTGLETACIWLGIDVQETEAIFDKLRHSLA